MSDKTQQPIPPADDESTISSPTSATPNTAHSGEASAQTVPTSDGPAPGYSVDAPSLHSAKAFENLAVDATPHYPTATTQPASQPAAAPTSTAAPPEAPTPASAGPVAELQAMFPSVDALILEAVLEAHHNDPSQCISDLLSMSDPDYKPSTAEMVESDEAMARRLAQEDAQAQAPVPGGGTDPSIPQQQPQQYGATYVSYQPRIRRQQQGQLGAQSAVGQGWQKQQQAGQAYGQGQADTGGGGGGFGQGLSPGAKDEIQKLQEEFGKLAGAGKKTAMDWFGKAKAKMQELQQPRQDQSGSSQVGYAGGVGSPEMPSPPSNQPFSSAGNSAAGGASRSGSKSSRITPGFPYGSRYDTPSTTHASTPNSSATGSSAPHNSDMGNRQPISLYDNTTTAPPSGRPDATPSLDPSKSALAGGTKVMHEDDEDLEYTRNPFEDDD